MKIVKRIISEQRIGQTQDGAFVEANRVEYTDGTVGTLYRLNRDDGRIYGLQSDKPALQEALQGLLIGEMA